MVYLNPIIRKSTLLKSIYLVTLVRNSGVWSNSSNLNNRFFFEGKRHGGNGNNPLGKKGKKFALPSLRNFPISFKPKVAIAEFFWKMQRKTWYSILGLDAMPLSLKNLLLIACFYQLQN